MIHPKILFIFVASGMAFSTIDRSLQDESTLKEYDSKLESGVELKYLQNDTLKDILGSYFKSVSKYREPPKIYTFGQYDDRDEVIAFHDERQVYDSNRNVNVDIAHPAIGKGKLIASYAEIWVSQTSDKGSAQLTEGGFDQGEFTINIQAQETTEFYYAYIIFGRWS